MVDEGSGTFSCMMVAIVQTLVDLLNSLTFPPSSQRSPFSSPPLPSRSSQRSSRRRRPCDPPRRLRSLSFDRSSRPRLSSSSGPSSSSTEVSKGSAPRSGSWPISTSPRPCSSTYLSCSAGGGVCGRRCLTLGWSTWSGSWGKQRSHGRLGDTRGSSRRRTRRSR